MTSLVNVSLKISNIFGNNQHFWLKKMKKLLIFSTKNISLFLVIKSLKALRVDLLQSLLR